MLFGIDVGNEESGYFIVDDDFNFIEFGKKCNWKIIELICKYNHARLVIEDIVLRGFAGKTLRGTIEWIGRFKQFAEDYKVDYVCYTPQKYRNVLCGTQHTDSKIRDALINRFGEEELKKHGIIGRRKNGIPKGSQTDIRSALALCLYEREYAE